MAAPRVRPHGRRRRLVRGRFTVDSLAGGLATSAGLLLAARAAQGVGGALASPAVLALIVGSFPEGRERTRALAIYYGRHHRRGLARPGARWRHHRARHPLPGAAPALQAYHALAHGMSSTFLLAAIFDAVALAVIITLIRARPPVTARPGRPRRKKRRWRPNGTDAGRPSRRGRPSRPA